MTNPLQPDNALAGNLERTGLQHSASSPGRDIVRGAHNAPHNALDTGPEDGRMLSTCIVEVGQPLASFVDAR